MEQVSSNKIGRYDVLGVLGRGGMGEVLLAMDENLGRRVAIKRPFKNAVEDGLARFQVEAKAAALRHPNIPAVYEMGTHDGLPYIAMEFVEGESLEKIIQSKRELDLITKLRIIEQVSSALGYAHENGIIHRDIKPANIIVQLDGTAKIIDFGIAKVQDQEGDSGLTKPSQVIGSLCYIAPERFWGGKVDGRADIFSTGVTLFKLLTGTEPFVGGEATASFKIMNEAHAPLSAYLQDYPGALDEIIEKSLAKSPDDRYQTGEDFADALHEVIEDLKRTRVTQLFGDAERLTTERRFAPALELLDEAIKLDPSNTQARKLRKFVKEHQERIRRAEKLRECLLKSDEAILSGNFDEALSQLKDAQNLDSASEDIKAKIREVEDKKRRFEASTRAYAEAERARLRGDITGALRVAAKALQEDPENKRLLSLNAELSRLMELEAQRGRLLELAEQATRALAARDFATAERLLNDAAQIDPSNLETDKLRRELAKTRELEQRRAALEEIQQRIQEFIENDAYEQASELVNRALEKLPSEGLLHRLKSEVEAKARKFNSRRAVELAIAQSNELFAASPVEALSVLQKAIEDNPGEERLIAYERSVRHQLEARRSEELRAQTLLKARELMDGRQFEKAVGVLETFQIEFGQQTDIDSLLAFARSELAAQQQADIVSRTMSEARSLVRDGRLDDAVRVLESSQQQTQDGAVSALLSEVREQQAAITRKFEALLKRIQLLRERGELDEAIRLLEEQQKATPGNATLQQLSESLREELKQKQATNNAINAASEATAQNNFAAALESLEGVVHAYGESAELTRMIEDVKGRRSAHAGEAVGKSIELARAALLKKDNQGALDALKTATPFLEFASAQKQADWQRIGESVKKALQQTGTTGSHAVFDDQLSAIAKTKPRQTILYAIIATSVLVLAVAGFAIWKVISAPKTTVARPQIELHKVPDGATVMIDGRAQRIGPDGNLIADVTQGSHKIVIAQPGFVTVDETVDVGNERTFYPFKLIPAGTPTGSLVVVAPSDLPRVRVSINGEDLGLKHTGDKIVLPVGNYQVKYSAPGYQDSAVHNVLVAKSLDSTDTVVMQKVTQTPPKPVPQQAAGGGKTTPDSKQPPSQTVLQPKGQLQVSTTSIERGQAVTLSWSVENAASIEIDPGIGAVNSSGSRQDNPSQTTTYQLRANGSVLDQQKVEVHDRPQAAAQIVKPQTPVTPSAAPQPAAPVMPDRATLQSALKPYEAFIQGAPSTGKSCKPALTSQYDGRFKKLADWCDAKSFSITENCSQLGGSIDEPTLTCEETITVLSKDRETFQVAATKTFRFKKTGENTYRLAGGW